MDSKRSAATRVTVVTEGIFVNRIQSDPELAGISAVLFDEVHERSLDSDFGLVLALDAQAALRPDLRLVAMSATLDGTRFAALMGDAPVVESEGRSWPLEHRYFGRAAEARIEDSVAAAVRTALREAEGGVLAFLPGVAEIERTAERLGGHVYTHDGVDLGFIVFSRPSYPGFSAMLDELGTPGAGADDLAVFLYNDLEDDAFYLRPDLQRAADALRERASSINTTMALSIYPCDIVTEMERRLEHPQAMLLVVPNGKVKLLNALPFAPADLPLLAEVAYAAGDLCDDVADFPRALEDVRQRVSRLMNPLRADLRLVAFRLRSSPPCGGRGCTKRSEIRIKAGLPWPLPYALDRRAFSG